jgi:hypothetical protein
MTRYEAGETMANAQVVQQVLQREASVLFCLPVSRNFINVELTTPNLIEFRCITSETKRHNGRT